MPLAKMPPERLLHTKQEVIKIIPGASLPLLGSAIFSCTGFLPKLNCILDSPQKLLSFIHIPRSCILDSPQKSIDLLEFQFLITDQHSCRVQKCGPGEGRSFESGFVNHKRCTAFIVCIFRDHNVFGIRIVCQYGSFYISFRFAHRNGSGIIGRLIDGTLYFAGGRSTTISYRCRVSGTRYSRSNFASSVFALISTASGQF